MRVFSKILVPVIAVEATTVPTTWTTGTWAQEMPGQGGYRTVTAKKKAEAVSAADSVSRMTTEDLSDMTGADVVSVLEEGEEMTEIWAVAAAETEESAKSKTAEAAARIKGESSSMSSILIPLMQLEENALTSSSEVERRTKSSPKVQEKFTF
jgi:hypothetical protein